MYISRRPWLAFGFVAVPLAYMQDLEGVVVLGLGIAALFDFYLTVRIEDILLKCLYIISWAVAVVAVVLVCDSINLKDNIFSKKDDILGKVDSTTIALLCTARAISLVASLLQTTRRRSPKIIRLLAYTLLIYLVQFQVIIHVNELAKLYRYYDNMHITTVKNCTSTSDTTGFVFNTSPFDIQCPTRVWKHIRVNMIFATQVYVLFTLSTDVWHNNGHMPKHMYQTVALAIVECIAVSAAASIQFDQIEGSEKLSLASTVLLLVAFCAYLARSVVSTTPHDAEYNDRAGQDSAAAADKAGALLRNPRARRPKLKDLRLRL